MTDQLLRALEHTRRGYERETTWHQFLIDAYTGGGGFQGSVRQPEVGWWGAAAERYAPGFGARMAGALPFSYLDRYAREDAAKYQSRIDVSHYWNYVGPLTDLKTSFMLRKPFTYRAQPEELGAWRQNVDGHRTSWDELRPLVALTAAIVGWAPVLIDMDPAQPGESVARASARGAGRPRAVPLMPSNLVDWCHDGTTFEWLKIRTDHEEHPSWNSAPTQLSRYRIWTPDSVELYEVRRAEGKDPSVTFLGVHPHPFGDVPLAIFRHAPWPGDPVRGLPMHGSVSTMAKRLFNMTSEIDEHMRGQVFAILVLARHDAAHAGEVSVGVDNGIPLDPEAKQKHYYLSPEKSVAETYERRIEATIREMYRAARVEFTRPTQASTSGVARKFEFAQTNRAIGDFAGEFARGEAAMDALAWKGAGRRSDELTNYQVQAADNFDIEDLSEKLRLTADAISLNLGAMMSKRLRLALAEQLAPNMPPTVRRRVEAEIDGVAA
jgi:hypothetical protein